METNNTMRTSAIILASAFIIALLLPGALAYSQGLPMMNLWDTIVEEMFGSYWVSVAFITLILSIILVLGNINIYTVIIFDGFFLQAMAMGYGTFLISVLFTIASFLYCLFQIIKMGENR